MGSDDLRSKVTVSACSDPGMVLAAVRLAKAAIEEKSKTAIVLLTSTCTEDGHGTHVSLAVMNKSGVMSATEARAACRRLRSLADELEERFAPKGSEN
jgi:hypothetical protein